MVETKGESAGLVERVREGALVAAAYGAIALVLVLANRASGEGSALWLGNGVLLGWLLRRQPVDAIGWLAVSLLADVGARLLLGIQPPLAAGLALADIAEVGFAWVALRGLAARDDGAESKLPVALAIGVLFAPLIGAALAALASQLSTAVPWRSGLVAWWLGHALGMLAMAPLMLAWDPTQARQWFGGARAGAFLLSLVSVLGGAALLGLSTAALPVVALVLLLAACRLDVFAVAVLNLAAVAAVVFVSMKFSTATGWLAPLRAPPSIQFGFAMALAGLAPLLVSWLRGQRDDAARRAQAASRDLQAVADHTPGLVARFDRDSRHRFANRSYLQWHGLSEQQVIGRTARDLYDESLAARMTRVLGGQAQQLAMPMPDGRELRAHYQPQFGDDGSVDGFYMLAEDVSWRGQSERRFAALLAAADAMVIIDATGRLVLGNNTAAELFAVSASAMPGMRAMDLLSEASRPTFELAMKSARQAQATPQAPLSVLMGQRGTSEFPVEIRLASLEGKPRGQVAATFRDLGELEQLERALHYEAALTRVMLDAVGDAVVACDRDGLIVLLNPGAEAMTGWTHAEALGRPLAGIIQSVGPKSGNLLSSPLQNALEGNRPVVLPPGGALLRRDGARLPIEASAAPVRDADGDAIGAVMVFNALSETRATAMKMSHLAQHDFLTDLPNRVLLNDRLSQALAQSERGSKGALLFVDLDYFKKINDTLGHQAGDRVLQEVAKRLVDAVRADDTVSRQGGDEFVLLLVRLADPRDAARVAEKLILAVEEPFFFEGQALHISASVGIALFPQDARDSKTLMKQADTALYHAKEAGRGRYRYFTGVMSEQADQRMRMEHDLRLALANDDFFLAYQPKVKLPEGRITGMEALVGWRRCDTHAIVPPEEFIPVAEETGLIVAMDEWAMREACRQNRAWQDAGLVPLPVSVNVSLARFDPERLLAHVRGTLEATGMAPQWLEIEFTERQMFTHLERAQQLIAQLKALGVWVAVDDFGSGHSSLVDLAHYKFDTLKIDRSFVQGLPDDPKHAAIVQAILGMARALDYRVIAEGVDVVAQAEVLQQYGCDEMQGLLYSRPLPAREFAALLLQGSIEHSGFTSERSRHG
jgi:diguanylate cyclase (GGDEF)-like protein/PAS domain S-box-containing protein